MTDLKSTKRVEILSEQELRRTISRLASQILESVSDTKKLLLLGMPQFIEGSKM